MMYHRVKNSVVFLRHRKIVIEIQLYRLCRCFPAVTEANSADGIQERINQKKTPCAPPYPTVDEKEFRITD